jgi:lysine/ornithine N-monooxygenase
MTDTQSGKELVEKAFVYMTALTKECRKALTTQFAQVHKGLAFESVEPAMRKEIESWFMQRDKNIRIVHEKSASGKPGEILLTFSGSNKDAHFKFQVDSLFTLTGNDSNAPSYLKSVNMYVDKRDFTK